MLAISLNPNIRKEDITRVFKSLANVFSQNNSQYIDSFVESFLVRFADSSYKAFTFITGRGAWFALLAALELEPDDEILIPAFTCVAVVNPIRWNGLTPVYVDIDSNFHVDLNDAEDKITSRTKALLIQHTFGQADTIQACKDFCDRHSIVLLEDCAHALGAKSEAIPTGLTGQAAFFSFGRDKCLTAGTGGLVMTNDATLGESLQKVYQSMTPPSKLLVIRHLVYILTTEAIYFFYSLHPVLGKLFHTVIMKLKINQRANSKLEKQGQFDSGVLHAWSPSLSFFGMGQLNNYDELLQARRNAARLYNTRLQHLADDNLLHLPIFDSNGVWLRYSILVQNPDEIRAFASKRNIILGDWYDQVIGPNQVDLDKIDYSEGIAPHAERLSKHVLNLPTSPRLNDKDLDQIIVVLQDYFEAHSNDTFILEEDISK